MTDIKQIPSIIDLFPGFDDRIYFQNDETKEFWFQATNVCKTLGYSNPSSALALHCDSDEKLMEIVRGKATWFVSESGCYGLAMGAKTETALKFKRWFKHDVLPSIRNQGGYISPDATPEQVQCLYDSYQTQIAAARETVKNIPISDPKIGTVARNIKHLERLSREEEMIKTFGRVVPYRNK